MDARIRLRQNTWSADLCLAWLAVSAALAAAYAWSDHGARFWPFALVAFAAQLAGACVALVLGRWRGRRAKRQGMLSPTARWSCLALWLGGVIYALFRSHRPVGPDTDHSVHVELPANRTVPEAQPPTPAKGNRLIRVWFANNVPTKVTEIGVTKGELVTVQSDVETIRDYRIVSRRRTCDKDSRTQFLSFDCNAATGLTPRLYFLDRTGPISIPNDRPFAVPADGSIWVTSLQVNQPSCDASDHILKEDRAALDTAMPGCKTLGSLSIDAVIPTTKYTHLDLELTRRNNFWEETP